MLLILVLLWLTLVLLILVPLIVGSSSDVNFDMNDVVGSNIDVDFDMVIFGIDSDTVNLDFNCD